MKRRWGLSSFELKIGSKFVLLISSLLLIAVVSVKWITTTPFIDDNKALVMEVNQEGAAALANRLSNSIALLVDRSKVLGKALLEGNSLAESAIAAQFFERNPDLLAVYMSYGSREPASYNIIHQMRASLDDSGLSESTVLQLSVKDPEQFSSLQAGEIQLRTLRRNNGSPAFLLSFPFVRGDSTYTHILTVVADYRYFGKIFEETAGAMGYLIDRSGRLLAKAPELSWENGAALTSREVVKQALISNIGNGQLAFKDPLSGERRLGVFKSLGTSGLTVITEVPESRAFEALRRASVQTSLFAVIILCLSLLIAVYFADSITYPISKLVDAAQRVGAGDFSAHVEIESRDELAQLSQAFNEMTRGLEERERVKDLFNKFHSEEIAKEILGGKVNLGGELKTAVILFSDIRGFTSMSEKMQPREVVELINEYMSAMIKVILRNQGVIDKFVGDAIMAIWGVPHEKQSDAFNAVNAALEMREELEKFNQKRLKAGHEALKIGVGLNMGSVVAGNIGSQEKMEYTVIGDAVNVASRIESLTKEFQTDLLISDTVAAQVGEYFDLELCARASVKGKSEALKVYKVLSRKENLQSMRTGTDG